MPVFTVEAPDGSRIKVEADDRETALRGAQEHYASKRSLPPRKNVGRDVRKSATAGLVSGVAGIAGQQGDILRTAPNALLGLTRRAGLINEDQERAGRGVVEKFAERAPQLNPANMLSPGMALNDLFRMGEAPTTDQVIESLPKALNETARYQPQTVAGEYARTAGQFAPNALLPGSIAARLGNVALPAVGSETAGQVARAAGAGAGGEAVARIVGGLAGGVGAGARAPQRPLRPTRNAAAEVALKRQDTAAMAAKAEELRRAGVQPSLVDVVDDSGRATVRAAASRMTPGRQKATNFRDARAMDLPDRMSAQAKRTMSDDARTPDQIRSQVAAQRKVKGDEAFGAVRGDEVVMPDDVLITLRTDAGRTVIKEAAQSARSSIRGEDRALAGELDQLASKTLDERYPKMSVGAAQEISKRLHDLAEVEFRAGRSHQGGRIKELADSIRSNARSKVPGYDEALQGWGADSRLIEAADVGENFLKRNTDEFADAAGGLRDQERDLARAAGRRAIERAAGESPSAAPGVARRLADAPEQRTRNAALLGDEGATQLQDAMRAEAQLVRNADDIAPRGGSQTQLRGQDASQVAADAVQAGAKVLRGDWVGLGVDWLRSRGMSDKMAESIVDMATDPKQLDEALSYVQARFGPDAARQFLEFRQGALATTAASGAIAAQGGTAQ